MNTELQFEDDAFYYYGKALRESIKRRNFRFMYQPFLNIKEQRISLELLARWEYNGEWIAPATFIPVLEKLSLMTEFNKILVEQLISDIDLLRTKFPELAGVSLNISPYLFKEKNEEAFLSYLIDRLQHTGIAHQQICLEITESSLIDDAALSFLEKCREQNFVVAIDDFGAGFSSYAYLGTKPFNVLKLDISLIKQITSNFRKATIVESIIDLANKLSVRVVAEGVEREDQYKLLKKMGVDAVQGYLISRPAFIEDLPPVNSMKN